MRNYLFALHGRTPKYKQIYEQFKTLIEQGYIKSDEQLPSIRKLAEVLQVSRNTTLTAYEQLEAEGYIRGEGRRGFFANQIESSLYSLDPQTLPQKENSEVKEPSVIVDFRTDAVDQAHFPLTVWKRITNQVMTLTESFQYGNPLGEMKLREQIATYLLASRGVKTDANNIIIGSSTQQMLIHLCHVLQDDYRDIIVEDPGFDGARAAFQFHRFGMEYLPVYESGVDLSKLEQMKSRLIYVTPSHHSPYGVSMPIKQRQTLIQWAEKLDGYIIEDDYDSEFRYKQQPFPALSSLDARRVIYLGNFAKSFLPGLRLSYMVLPQPLLERYEDCFTLFESSTSLYSQLKMAKFMEEGEWSRHIRRMRIVYKRKMDFLVEQLKAHFGKNIALIGEHSGLYILVKVFSSQSEQQLIEQALYHGVKVRPTSIYFVQQGSDHPIIKLGFSGLTLDEIEQGVKLLKKAWL